MIADHVKDALSVSDRRKKIKYFFLNLTADNVLKNEQRIIERMLAAGNLKTEI